MNEGKPKDEKVVDLTERQRQEMNANRRKSIEITSEGRIRYPEEVLGITTRQAIEIAKRIVEDTIDLDESKIASQREYISLSSVGEILKALERYEKSPELYSREYARAIAEELMKRFPAK
ncbi:MAG: hypothetical protein WC814_01465 [Candidatus Paceibacterota bacterium]|jgi:hypothetical protein